MSTTRALGEKRIEAGIYAVGLMLCGAIGATVFLQLKGGAVMPCPETSAIVGAVVGVIFGNIPSVIIARRHAPAAFRACQKYFQMCMKS